MKISSMNKLFKSIEEWNQSGLEEIIEQYVTMETFLDIEMKPNFSNFFKPRLYAIKHYIPATALNNDQLLFLRLEYDIIPQEIPTYIDSHIQIQGKSTWSKANKELERIMKEEW